MQKPLTLYKCKLIKKLNAVKTHFIIFFFYTPFCVIILQFSLVVKYIFIKMRVISAILLKNYENRFTFERFCFIII